MIKKYCDRCGKEMGETKWVSMTQAAKALNSIRYTLTSRIGMSDTRTYDLCDDCQYDLYNWLNDGGDTAEEEKGVAFNSTI